MFIVRKTKLKPSHMKMFVSNLFSLLTNFQLVSWVFCSSDLYKYSVSHQRV